MQETLYLITLKTIKHMKISTKAATFLSSIKTQTYDKKESEITTVQRNYPIGSVDLNRNHSSDVLV